MNPQDLQQIEQYLRSAGLNANELRDRMDAIRNSTTEFNRELANAQRHFSEISNEFRDLSKQFKNVLDDLRGWDSTSGRINRSFKTLGGLADKLKYDALDINKLNKKDLESLQKKAKAEVENLKTQKEALDVTYKNANLDEVERIAQENGLTNTLKEIAQYRELTEIFDDQNNLREEENNYVYRLNKLTQERLADEIRITKNLGAMGAIYNSISTTLQNLGVNSEIIKEMGEELTEAAKKGKVGFKELFPILKKGLTEALQDPLVKFSIGLKLAKSGINDIKKAFDIFLEFDKIFTDTARSLGMSVNQIHEMTNAAKFTGNQFGNNAYTAEQVNKAIAESNAQLGLSVDLGAATTNEFTAMTNQMGLSAEEATNIYKLGLLNNKSLKDTNKSIAAGIVAAQKSTGVQINAKQVFQEIGKLSAGILVKFRQNPEALAKAVAQAKALGTNLEQVDKVGESLLNFESSIENELKAELLTGKQLNLEKARYAALTGDQVTLTKELANQVGSLEDFQNMNVLQQKSLAEAFGMTQDEVADLLQKQETYNKLGDVSGKSAAEQLQIAKERGLTEEDSLVVNLQQQAASEKLAATFDSLKTILAELLTGPFKGIIDAMAFLSKHATLVSMALGAMASISLVKTIGGLLVMATQLGIISVGAITASQALTFGLTAVVIGAAIAGLMSLFNSSKSSTQSVKDGQAPSSDGPFTITNRFGATAITATGDGVAVGPNINTPKETSTLGGNIDLTPMIAAITEVKNAVNALASRPAPQFSLNVDGKAIGTVVGKQIETGTAQSQYTSYKVA